MSSKIHQFVLFLEDLKITSLAGQVGEEGAGAVG